MSKPEAYRRRKILFHNSYPGIHGSQKMAQLLLSGLPEKEWEVWAGAPFNTAFLQESVADEYRLDGKLPEGLRVFRGKLLRRNPLSVLLLILPYWWRTWRALKRRKFDLLYASNERCLFLIGIPARLAGIPVLWHIQSGFRMGKPWVHQLAGRIATRAVAVSEAVRSDARLVLPKRISSKIVLIYNGLEDVASKSQSISQEKTRLFYAGAITPEKGLHVLLDALHLLPPTLLATISLQVAGESKEQWYDDIVREKARDLHVQFLGYRDDVPDLLAQSDIAIVPSIESAVFDQNAGSPKVIHWKEGFNLVALEGMRAGVAVLAAATYGLKEVVEDGQSGLHFETGNAEDLAQKLALLLAQPQLRQALAKGGRERFAQHFSAAAMRSRFYALFETMVETHG